MPDVQWSPDWPTEPGWYWFYGHRYPASKVRVLRLVSADLERGLILLTDGDREYFPGNAGPHVWARAEVPAPPETLPENGA
jgi:hypothetical protein